MGGSHHFFSFIVEYLVRMDTNQPWLIPINLYLNGTLIFINELNNEEIIEMKRER